MKQNCEICQKLKEKKEDIIYEDDSVIVILPKKVSAKGHIRIFSKKHTEHLEELGESEVDHFLTSASYAAIALFEIARAQGTNIICNNGEFIGALPHLSVDIIARKFDDGLNFQWEPKQATQNELEDISGRIKSKVGVKQEKEKPTIIEEKTEKQKIIQKKGENYLIKQLHRMP